MKRLAIFDLDGTLLNTIADLATATNQALAHFGYPTHNTEAYRFFVGNGIDKLFERALPEDARTQENILKIRSRFLPYYNEHNADLSRPYPGITEMLRSLQSHRILMAVASNKYQAATQKLIGHFFPDIAFTAILGQREGIPAKPNPQIVFEIMEKAGIEKKDTAYIGDSGVDMETGRNAGVDTIGVVWGFRPREELEACRPQLIAHQCEDILKFLHNR